MVISEKFDDETLDDPEADFDIKLPEEEAARTPEEIEAEADAVLRDITSRIDTRYALHDEPEAEELDPEAMAERDPIDDGAEDVESQIAAEEVLDELPEDIDIDAVPMPKAEGIEPMVPIDIDEQFEKKRRGLKRTLLIMLIILLVIAAGIGVAVWLNATHPNIEQSDTQALSTSDAGAVATQFQPVDSTKLVNLSSLVGIRLKDAKSQAGKSLVFSKGTEDTGDDRIPSLEKIASATMPDASGQTLASIALGTDKDGVVVYAYAAYDLDALSVADATFEELANDKTVLSSLLAGNGVTVDALNRSKLTIAENPKALTSTDTSSQERAEFSGKTGLDRVPKHWTAAEVYDHTTGEVLGDNSVMRTIIIELY